MKHSVVRMGMVLIFLVLLSVPFVFAHSESANEGYQEEAEGLELGVISGLVTFLCVASTVTTGWLMKKGKVRMKTHHVFAYTTLVLALFHGIFNLLSL
jgi:hypothetical protein